MLCSQYVAGDCKNSYKKSTHTNNCFRLLCAQHLTNWSIRRLELLENKDLWWLFVSKKEQWGFTKELQYTATFRKITYATHGRHHQFADVYVCTIRVCVCLYTLYMCLRTLSHFEILIYQRNFVAHNCNVLIIIESPPSTHMVGNVEYVRNALTVFTTENQSS